MSEARSSDRGFSAWRLAFAVVVLHAITVFPLPWENVTPVAAWFRISPDLVFVVAVCTVLVLGVGATRWVAHLGTLLVLMVPAYRFGATVMPAFFDRPFVPFDDVMLLPSLAHLLGHEADMAVVIGVSAVVVVVAILVWLGLYRAVRCVTRVVADRSLAWIVLGCAQLLVLCVVVERASTRGHSSRFLRTSMLGLGAESVLHEIKTGGWRARERVSEQVEQLQTAMAGFDVSLEGLGGADVYVMFIESLGACVLREPKTREAYVALATELSPALDAAGVSVRSGWIRNGGAGSRGSHLQFLTGILVDGFRTYDAILRSSAKAMPKFFAEAGYLTVNVQPAVDVEWPTSREFFGFERDLFRQHMPYEGWHYHWGEMPDQHALGYLLRMDRGGDRPVFAQYVSVTSHGPFRDIPPYYEDWGRLEEPGVFARPDHSYELDWANLHGHPESVKAYLDTILYSVRTVAGFAMQLERPAIVIALGDHPPPLSFGPAAPRGREFDVPIHVFSNRAELLAEFDWLSEEFVPSLELLPGSTKWMLPWVVSRFGRTGGK